MLPADPPVSMWRGFSTRWMVVGGVAFTVSLGWLALDPRRWASVTIAALTVLPAGEPCAGAVDVWTSLVRGRVDPRDAARCFRAIPDTRAAHGLAEGVARQRSLPVPAREAAVSLLARRGGPSRRAAAELLRDPATPPDLRRWTLDALRDAPDAEWWAAVARAVAVHGLFGDAARILGAAGEPGFAEPARRAMTLDGASPPPGGSVNFDWTPPDEPGAPQPALPVSDGFIVAASGADETYADALREEILATSRWVAVADPERRERRLSAAVLHADPAPGRVDPGDVHATLVRGRGTPGTTAMLSAILGEMTNTDVRAWAVAEGDAMGAITLSIGAGFQTLPWCGPVRGTRSAPGGTPLSLREIEAVALLEVTHRLLHRGDWQAAFEAARSAVAAWPGVPGGTTAALFVAGYRPAGAPAIADPTHALRVVTIPARRGLPARMVPDPRPDAMGAVRAAFQRAAALDLEPRTVAAFWLARAGQGEAAHVLFPPLAPRELGDVHAATALLLDEPAVPAGPLSAWIATGVDPGELPCAAAYRLLPGGPVTSR